MLDKATAINCEYLLRPKVTLSELAERITANQSHLETELHALNTGKTIQALANLEKIAAPFNTPFTI